MLNNPPLTVMNAMPVIGSVKSGGIETDFSQAHPSDNR